MEGAQLLQTNTLAQQRNAEAEQEERSEDGEGEEAQADPKVEEEVPP